MIQVFRFLYNCFASTLQINFIDYYLFAFGATKQNRTADLRVTNPLLYQLSYSGILFVLDFKYIYYYICLAKKSQ